MSRSTERSGRATPNPCVGSEFIAGGALLSDRLTGEKGEKRGVEIRGLVEHGHVGGPPQQEQLGVRYIPPQEIAYRRGY